MAQPEVWGWKQATSCAAAAACAAATGTSPGAALAQAPEARTQRGA
jgi:hypothetical protein